MSNDFYDFFKLFTAFFQAGPHTTIYSGADRSRTLKKLRKKRRKDRTDPKIYLQKP